MKKLLSFSEACRHVPNALGARRWVFVDVFDTLIRRRCHSAAPVYAAALALARANPRLGLSRIRTERARAHAELCRRSVERGLDAETSLRDLAIAWTDRIGEPACAEIAIQAETEAELAASFPSPEVRALCREVRLSGRRIAAVSDVHLGGGAVRRILGCSGCEHLVDAVFVSADYGLTKRSGRLFELALRSIGIGSDDVLHIGDNVRADLLGAARAGVESILVLDVRQSLRRAEMELEHEALCRGDGAPFLARFLLESRMTGTEEKPVADFVRCRDQRLAAALRPVWIAASAGGGSPTGEGRELLAAALDGLGLPAHGAQLRLERRRARLRGAKACAHAHADCALVRDYAVAYRQSLRYGVTLTDLATLARAECRRLPGSYRRRLGAWGLATLRLASGLAR